MKILFICGSLEPGCDGVGDYTARLARELNRKGHRVSILAIADRFVKVVSQESTGKHQSDIEILRIPYQEPFILKAKEWVNKQDPDWLSLQYVPFSFNDRGLPFGLSNDLLEIGRKRKWQIMFHELWVGMEKGSNLKSYTWGILQKMLIKNLLTNLTPLVIHTQSKLYQAQLGNLGHTAHYLPLFSNIPCPKKVESHTFSDIYLTEKKKEIRFIIFGTIHKHAPIKAFAKEARQFQKNNNINMKLIIVGRHHAEQEFWRLVWNVAGMDVELLGELSPLEVSGEMLNSSIGLATTAYPLIEKSGSVAALHEHGLNVICVANAWEPRLKNFQSSNKNIIQYKVGSFKSCIKTALKTRKKMSSDISSISADFIKSLESHI